MSKNSPTSSLIVSTYNWPAALKVSLLSIAKQRHLPSEVIVADDGSREDTWRLVDEIRKSYPCPLVHVWHEDKGFRLAAIRNKAIAVSKGDYIIQIDGDIILEKNFVKDHLSFASPKCFSTGSRVVLSPEFSKEVLEEQKINISLFSKGVSNHINGLRCKLLRNCYRFHYRLDDPYYVKGCNMAFWRKDLLAVNGYNEDITGWGAEDSELAARLIFLGVKRQFIKMSAVEYHIYHKLNYRDRERYNYDVILKEAIDSKTPYCINGLDKYL